MAGTRKARVPMAEQIRLINECRQLFSYSGLSKLYILGLKKTITARI